MDNCWSILYYIHNGKCQPNRRRHLEKWNISVFHKTLFLEWNDVACHSERVGLESSLAIENEVNPQAHRESKAAFLWAGSPWCHPESFLAGVSFVSWTGAEFLESLSTPPPFSCSVLLAVRQLGCSCLMPPRGLGKENNRAQNVTSPRFYGFRRYLPAAGPCLPPFLFLQN